MKERSMSEDGYRFGFQAQEQDQETGWVNYKYRMHNPALGKFFAVDPLTHKYPQWSPYAFSGNQVIHTFELEGLEPWKDINRYAADLEARNAANANSTNSSSQNSSSFRGDLGSVSSFAVNTITAIDGASGTLGLTAFNPDFVRDIGFGLTKSGLFNSSTTFMSEGSITINATGVNGGSSFMDDAFNAGAKVAPSFFANTEKFVGKASKPITGVAVLLDGAGTIINVYNYDQDFREGAISRDRRDAEITSSAGGFSLRTTIAVGATYNPYVGMAGLALFGTSFISVESVEQGGILDRLGYTHRFGVTHPWKNPERKSPSLYDFISNGVTSDIESSFSIIRTVGWKKAFSTH